MSAADRNPATPTDFELACSWQFGFDRDVAPLRPVSCSAREAAESVVREALRRPPCLVTFSGGRDSSAVLALAVHVARREGFELPVPYTMRFASARTDEHRWQTDVLRHLGIGEHIEVDLGTRLDFLGPEAQRALAVTGVVLPPNVHAHLPALDAAGSGTVLTGIGGDEVWGLGWHAAARTWRGRGLRPRDLARAVVAVAPAGLRRHLMGRYVWDPPDWVRPERRRDVRRALARDAAAMPMRFDRAVATWWRHRARTGGARALAALAASTGAAIVHPFGHPEFLAAVAREWGAVGPGSRTAGLRRLVGDLLPAALLERRTKAVFDDVFVGPWSRAFAASWEGGHLDASLVDVAALRDRWRRGEIAYASAALLQAAWYRSGAQPIEVSCVASQ